MSTSALIGLRPIARSRFCIHSGEGPLVDAADETQGEGRAEMPVLGREIETHAGRAIERAFIRFRRRRLELSESRRGEIARDSRDPGGVGTVRRHRDVDDRIVEPGEARVSERRPARRRAVR